MAGRILLCVGLLWAKQAAAQSSLYPSVDPVRLANAFNISIGCLDALNETVTCDATLLQMAGSVDDYLWDVDNVTALCTQDCLSSASTWFTEVNNQCANDVINVNGRLIPPISIPGRVVDGMNIACLTPDTNVLLDPGVNGSVFTSTVLSESNSTVIIDSSAPTAAPTTISDSSSERKRQTNGGGSGGTSNSTFCLIESYSWVGSDIIRPDCPEGTETTGNGTSQCSDPTDVPPENERIANLYPNSLLCSTCFINMFYLRVASPYLPDLDYSDYLVSQYFDIVDVCEAEMPDLLVRALPYYDYAPGTFDGMPDVIDNGTSSSNSSSSIAVACSQTLSPDELDSLIVPDPNANGTIYCDALSNTYNVTTGDLQAAFDNFFCLPTLNFTSVCLPAGCTLMQVPSNATCDSMAALISTALNNVTATQFATWNPNLQGFCDQLVEDQYACISAPGGSYVSPPVSNSTTNDGDQERGGGDGSGTATGSGGVAGGGRNATTITMGGKAPSPTQSGITPACTEYAQAQSGDGCYSLSSLWQISEQELYAWNTVLGPNGANCSTQLFAAYWYCIGVQGSTTTSSVPSSTSTTASTPYPVQSGIDPQCTSYAEATSGQYCSVFASGNNITPAQLYQWNPVLGVNGANCNTAFEANTYYCVGAPSAATPTTTSTPSSTPSPVQAGIDPQCTSYAEAKSGEYCSVFASNSNITPTQLYQWNPVLGQNGANCNTAFQANTYYCIGAPSVTPSPVQSGIDPQCTSYAEPKSGDYCSVFATDNNITPTQLYQWNPVLGPNGANCNTEFLADTYYCIGAPAVATPTTTPAPSVPSPTQAGIVSNCNKYAEATSGEYCSVFASNNNITPAQLYQWNTVLGQNGANCNTAFQANTYYCTGVSS